MDVASPAGPPGRGTASAAGAMALLLAALFLLPHLIDIPLLDPDEGLHGAIAREMAASNDWVTPRFLGEPFLDKPPLFFWAQALSVRLFGLDEAAVRLPGSIFGLLGAITTGLVAGALFGSATGLVATVFYATMLLPLALAQAPVHDVALVPWTNLAILALWRMSDARTSRDWLVHVVVAGVCLGLAMLTKALSGVAVVGLALALALLLQWKLTPRTIMGGFLALGVATCVAGPWYLAMEGANPGYLHYYFVERHLEGYTTTMQRHGYQPWWFYVPVLAGGALPWTGHLASLTTPRRASARTGARGALVLAAAWFTGGTIFFSLAGSKLVTYVLPVMPALAVLCAAAWTGDSPRARGGGPSRVAARAGAVAQAVLMSALVPLSLVVIERHFALEVGRRIWPWTLALAAGWWTVAWLSWRERRVAAMGGAAALIAATLYLCLLALGPVVSDHYSARALAQHFNARGAFPGRLLVVNERIGSLVFYLDDDLARGLTPDRVANAGPADIFRPRQPVDGLLVAVPMLELPRLSRFVDPDAVPFETAGHYRLYTSAAIVDAVARRVGRR